MSNSKVGIGVAQLKESLKRQSGAKKRTKTSTLRMAPAPRKSATLGEPPLAAGRRAVGLRTSPRKASNAEVQKALERILANGFDTKPKNVRTLAKSFTERDEMGDFVDPALLGAIVELIKQYGHYAETALTAYHAAEIVNWLMEKVSKSLALGEASMETAEGREHLRQHCFASITTEKEELLHRYRLRHLNAAEYSSRAAAQDCLREFVERSIR
jgi:hypothetical protein